MTRSKVRNTIVCGALILCIALNAWIYWPRAKGSILKAGGTVQTLTRPDHRGELAITLPDTIGDAELEQMSALDRLKPVYIQVQGRRITGEGLKWLKRFPYIFGLTLHGTTVGDDDMTQLAAFPKLDTLNLDASPISDRGLLLLKDLRSLQSVSVRATLVTAKGIQKLQGIRPDLLVLSNFTPDNDD
jgi:hypothetical protein